MSPNNGWRQVAEYTPSRVQLGVYGAAVGILLGFASFFLGIELHLGWRLVAWLAVALVVVVALHEGVHGLIARLLGYHPEFGLESPLVYITFKQKVKRDHYIWIALGPLLLLDVIFASSFAAGVFEELALLGFGINTIGATGDVWVTTKALRHSRSSWVQDTKKGVEIWTR